MGFESDIESLTKEQMLNPSFIPSIFENYKNKEERDEILKEILVIAKGQQIVGKLKKAINYYEKDSNLTSALSNMNDEMMLAMKFNNNGTPNASIDNYVHAIQEMEEFKGAFKYNSFTNKMQRVEKDGSVRTWSDSDDAWMMSVIETKLQIYDYRKFTQALSLCEKKVSYHPIKSLIEETEWDGVPRIDRFLTDIMHCDDDTYSREVSRMIFYGGISRLYYPGCKFDYMPIFIGEQGTCKSTLISWLAMDTGSYKEVLTIEGKEGAELLKDAWICEFSELLAMVRSREVESMKAYITREVDSFRPAYGRHVVDNPRHCIFIGTTNNYEFLIDKTGNRRYLPIEINTNKGELYGKEKAIKHCILECWREAKYLMDNDLIYLTIPNEYMDIVEEHRARATEDDPQEGMISDYLSNKDIGDKVCGIEIFTEVFKDLAKNYNRVKARDISNLMRRFNNWKKSTSTTRFEQYGTQKYWERKF